MTIGMSSSEVVLPGGLPVFVAAPDRPGPFPCVVWMHERYGFVRHTREYAEKLAGGGYVVAAPDLYYDFPDQAGLHAGSARMGPIADPVVSGRLADAVGHLATVANADTGRLGMIGVCATGRYPLVYGARHPLQAAVVYYGATSGWDVTDEHPESMPSIISRSEAPVLGLFGERDHNISLADVTAFRDLLEQHRRSYRIVVYEGAPHGFMNDTMSGRYDPIAEASAFLEVQRFLATNLAPGGPDTTRVNWSFDCVQAASYDYSANVRLE